ncbi:nucleoside-diphosphate sugar epimerase/dehydratase [soil metagenome]
MEATRPAPGPRGIGFPRKASLAKEAVGRIRTRHLFVMDVLSMAVAVLAAHALAMNALPTWSSIGQYLWVLGIVVATRTAMNIGSGLYRSTWRFASVSDMGRIIACVVGGTVAAAAIVWTAELLAERMGVPSQVPPVSFWMLEMFLSLAVLAGPRFAIRAASDIPSDRRSRSTGKSQRTLLYGAGWAGVMVARSATRDKQAGILPVGFLDDDPDLAGRRVAGLRVFGDARVLERAIRATAADVLLITMPSAPGSAVRRIVQTAAEHGIEVRTVPTMTDVLDGSLDASRIRRVRVEDLLRRPMAQGHAPAVQNVFQDTCVVITGAAGSIGSELARQVLAVGPRILVLVDQAESGLYLVHHDLKDHQGATRQLARWANTQLRMELANVADRQEMERVIDTHRPDVILHAAAYKHVPMLEDHPDEAVRVNIGGTLAVVEAAAAHGVDRLVLVSTDKAVRPSSVMGASKRVAEMIVADAARRLGRPYISVRFGNVLGSSGSVVPIFQDQLEKGLPLTITHTEMTRFFMTIPEAAWLILDAVAIADRGGLYVLDMGQPVRIMDIANDLIRLSGRDPESVPISITGLRKGEKLHEELFYDQERAQPTSVAKVLRADSPSPPEGVRQQVERLMALAEAAPATELTRELHACVRQWVRLDEERWASGALRPAAAIPIETGYEPQAWIPAHGQSADPRPGQAVYATPGPH